VAGPRRAAALLWVNGVRSIGYDIPSIGFHQRALTSVTYIHKGDNWLSIADQGTLLP